MQQAQSMKTIDALPASVAPKQWRTRNAKIDAQSPGQLISALLIKRGWSQRTLARILDVGESQLTRLIADKQPVDAQFALMLQEVFGAPAEQFLALRANCELAYARRTRALDPKFAERMRLYGELPIGDMIRRGWLNARAVHDAGDVAASLLTLFDVDCAERIDDVLQAMACDDDSQKTLLHAAWLMRLRHICAGRKLSGTYTPQRLREGLVQLRAQMRRRDDVRKVPAILSSCGVDLAIIEPLKGGDLDGGCIETADGVPAIGLSLRHDRLDHFWLALRHQLEHILNDSPMTASLDIDLSGGQNRLTDLVAEREHAANEAAHEFCVARKQVDEFLETTGPIVTERDLEERAEQLGLHPSILATEIAQRMRRPNRFRCTAPKVRAHLAAQAIVDGWGHPTAKRMN
jgi:HTH-type transcriptional regulator/antitoxin HigA